MKGLSRLNFATVRMYRIVRLCLVSSERRQGDAYLLLIFDIRDGVLLPPVHGGGRHGRCIAERLRAHQPATEKSCAGYVLRKTLRHSMCRAGNAHQRFTARSTR